MILASQFHPALSRALIRGAQTALRRAGVPERGIRLVRVPGSFELPMAAAAIAQRAPRPHAIIALGALIRGETPQYALLAQAVIHGLMHVALHARLPVTCGVIVAQDLAQARARAGGSMGNRGAEAAAAALDLLPLFQPRA